LFHLNTKAIKKVQVTYKYFSKINKSFVLETKKIHHLFLGGEE